MRLTVRFDGDYELRKVFRRVDERLKNDDYEEEERDQHNLLAKKVLEAVERPILRQIIEEGGNGVYEMEIEVDETWWSLLPRRQKQVFRRRMEGASLDRIAEELGIAKNTVKEHYRRARRSFEEALDEDRRLIAARKS